MHLSLSVDLYFCIRIVSKFQGIFGLLFNTRKGFHITVYITLSRTAWVSNRLWFCKQYIYWLQNHRYRKSLLEISKVVTIEKNNTDYDRSLRDECFHHKYNSTFLWHIILTHHRIIKLYFIYSRKLIKVSWLLYFRSDISRNRIQNPRAFYNSLMENVFYFDL